MSAYVVKDETINRIVGYLYGLANESHPARACLRPLEAAGYILQTLGNGHYSPTADLRALCERLGCEMHLLNIASVRARYKNADAEEMIPPMYKHRHAAPSPVWALKSLDCWLYQCSEGKIPETSALYRAFKEVSSAIAEEITRNSAEYAAAPWA